jgi:hypothetical protein
VGLFQLADFDISIPAIVLVVGEHDVAGRSVPGNEFGRICCRAVAFIWEAQEKKA